MDVVWSGMGAGRAGHCPGNLAGARQTGVFNAALRVNGLAGNYRAIPANGGIGPGRLFMAAGRWCGLYGGYFILCQRQSLASCAWYLAFVCAGGQRYSLCHYVEVCGLIFSCWHGTVALSQAAYCLIPHAFIKAVVVAVDPDTPIASE